MEHTVVEMAEITSVDDQQNPSSSQQQQQQPSSNLHLPCMDLINDVNDYLNICVPLYKACMEADWIAAKVIFDQRPELVRYAITHNGDAPLHVVVRSGKSVKQQEVFIQNLVQLMQGNDINLQNKDGKTGLDFAMASVNATLVEQTVGEVELASVQDEHNIPSSQQQEQPQPPNLPCMDLISGGREDYFNICVPLYQASMKGDWKAAKAIFDLRPELVRHCITLNGETALHVVAGSDRRGKQMEVFGQNLLNLMETDDLALQNSNYCTALSLAAAAGNLMLVKMLVEKNKASQTIFTGSDITPLFAAALYGKHEVVNYLYNSSNEMSDVGWTRLARCWVLEVCVKSDMFDVALQIAKKYPDLGSKNILNILAEKSDAFSDTKLNGFGRTRRAVSAFIGSKVGAPEKETKALQLLRIILEDILKNEGRTFSARAMFPAAEMGNTKFVVEFIRRYPEVSWMLNEHKQTIFHIAVKHRHQDIYNLLYEIGSMKDLIFPIEDENGNYLLHLAGMRATRLDDVPGVMLQMQQELLWFKEVESIMPASYREKKNKDGRTPRELFTEEHKDLVTQGEKWTKETASQCMVVSALIATIVFASAFTTPGGYDQNTGMPLLYLKPAFIIFVVADAISLFSASASILMFLSILTSRFAQRDFMESLPKKLISGLATLFLSITTMMIAFSVNFFVLYDKDLKWMPILISILATIPVLLYVGSQYSLSIDVVRSTYGFMSLFKFRKNVLYD